MHRLIIHPYIIDFDTCDDVNNPSDILCGTPLYMAPEAFTSNAGFAGDLYGVGVIVYALMVCDLPGGAEDIFHSLDGALVTAVPLRALQRLKRRVVKALEKINWDHEIWTGIDNLKEFAQQLLNVDPGQRGGSAGNVLKTAPWFIQKRKRYARLAMTKAEKETHELRQLKQFLDTKFASIELAFQGLDLSGDNLIGLDELTVFLKNRLNYLGDPEALHRDLDKDGDGEVTWEEFASQLNSVQAGAVVSTKSGKGGGWADLDRRREARATAEEEGCIVMLDIIEARGLVQVDFDTSKFTRGKVEGGGSSDPYVKVMVAAEVQLGKAPKEKEVFRTPIIEDSLDPVWNCQCKFPMGKEEKVVVLRMYDHDPGPEMLDDEMGQVTLPMPLKVNRWFTMEPTPNCRDVSGEIHLKVNYVKVK